MEFHLVGSSPTTTAKKRVVTKDISTGALEASVSGFDSHLLDKKMELWLNGLQYHPVTVCGAGSNPVSSAKKVYSFNG